MKRSPYSGKQRKLILAFDIGTTYSGISYSILDPGKVPEIQGVHRFPGQVKVGGDAKIPSVLYYDREGVVKAVGAEAEGDGIEIVAEEEDWVKVSWFKLHLRPKSHSPLPKTITIPPLPPTKSILDVLSDFLKYLKKCAKEYIEDVHPDLGKTLWKREGGIQYILSHPNRWEGYSQGLMREAAERAGLIGFGKVMFISEGEASLNRCVEKDLMNDSIRNGDGVVIVDAGGGTVDFSAYALDMNSGGGHFEEIAEPLCHYRGSEFVTEAAGVYLNKLLKGSKYHSDVPDMKKIFNRRAKCAFRDPKDPCFIQFGSVRDRDRALGITAGKLRLEGEDVAKFFEPAIGCIVDSVLDLSRVARKPIRNVFIVGGFSDNGYLFKKVKDSLQSCGLRVSRPDARVNKAVADGAVADALDHPVRSRITHHAYGVKCLIVYDSTFPDHVQRKSQCTVMYSGEKAIPNGFNLLIPRNSRVADEQEFRCGYMRTALSPGELAVIEKEIFTYEGNLPAEKYKWMDNDPAGFRKLCTVKADSHNVPITTFIGKRGQVFYKIEIDVVLLVGGTEPKAQIAWKDRGKEKRRDAGIIYDVDGQDELDSHEDTDSLGDIDSLEDIRANKYTPPRQAPRASSYKEATEIKWTTVGRKKAISKGSKTESTSSSSPRERYFHPWLSPPSNPSSTKQSPRTWRELMTGLDWAADPDVVDWAADPDLIDWAAEEDINDWAGGLNLNAWPTRSESGSDIGMSRWEYEYPALSPTFESRNTWGVPIWKGGRKQPGKRV